MKYPYIIDMERSKAARIPVIELSSCGATRWNANTEHPRMGYLESGAHDGNIQRRLKQGDFFVKTPNVKLIS